MQEQWQRITLAIRLEISRRIATISKLSIGEMRELVAAVDDAMWMECKAAAYDAMVEARIASLQRESAFGG